jgi:transcriptional regulator with XRE-family HTH domain
MAGRRREGLQHIDAEVGRRIRKARIDRGMSQGELGQYLNVSFQQIQKYEKGFNSVSLCRLPDLCGALGLSAASLVTGIDVPAKLLKGRAKQPLK